MATSLEPPPNDDVDDYMSMAIAEPAKPFEKETYTQRRIRKQREVDPFILHDFSPS